MWRVLTFQSYNIIIIIIEAAVLNVIIISFDNLHYIYSNKW